MPRRKPNWENEYADHVAEGRVPQADQDRFADLVGRARDAAGEPSENDWKNVLLKLRITLCMEARRA